MDDCSNKFRCDKMPIALYKEIAKCNRFIQESFSIEDDKIAIKNNQCIITENGELVFSNIKSRSLQEYLTLIIEFFRDIEDTIDRLSERKKNLRTTLKEAKSVERYVDEEDRGRYKETCKNAISTISDLLALSDNAEKILGIKKENLNFFRRESQHLLSNIYREITPVLKKYHRSGIPIDPMVINVKIEVMDI